MAFFYLKLILISLKKWYSLYLVTIESMPACDIGEGKKVFSNIENYDEVCKMIVPDMDKGTLIKESIYVHVYVPHCIMIRWLP